MKKARTGFWIAAMTAAILLLLIVPAASAQDQNYDQDPPTRAGRLGYVEGSVSFQPGGEGDWVQAVPNRPLTVGDNLWVDRDSRAEVQIGSTSIRLGPETSLTFLDLGNDSTQLRLSMGSLFFRIRQYGGQDVFEVDTPNLAFNVNRPGEFRLNVNGNGDQTVATVWHGEAEITGGGNSYRLMEGQRGSFSGVDQLSYDVDQIGPQDPFDRWAMSRDEREDRTRSSRYVSSEMTGYEDLDDYGRWHEVSGYGNVWTPSGTPGDWAPYRYGHWVYVSPWGWTWVEDEPWGFAPFHYGRWAFVQSSWCWVPGPVAVAPVYSPALVAFVGGGGFSIGVGVGSGVGWFPLAPGEVFVPWYRTSPRYVQNVNVTNTRVNVTQVTNVYNNVTVNHVNNVTYVNQRVTNSVTVVNHDTFVNARPVHNNIVRVDARQIASAPVTHEAVRNMQPQRQSLIGATRPAPSRPPEQAMTRQVVATRQPVAINRAAPVPGAARAAAPPPLKTVRAAPPAEAKPLERGARGGAPGRPANEASPRPGAAGNSAPENRGPDSNRPGAPANNPPAAAAPRPGAPENNRPGAENNRPENNRPGAPDNNRPGAENNRAVPRPGGPGAAPRPNAPDNNNRPGPDSRPGGMNNRPGAPDNNRPGAENNRAVPRPGAPEAAPRPNTPESNRPGAGRPNETPQPGNPNNNREAAPPRPSAPENRPNQPDNNRMGQQPSRPPSASRPDTAPEQPRQAPNARPEASRPQNTRPETPRTQPEEPARPPQARQQAAPPQNDNRSQPASRPEARSEPAPRPEARPAQPPPQPQRDSRPADQRNDRRNPPSDDKKKNDNNQPPHFR
jgi:hypothetical protein